MSTELNK